MISASFWSSIEGTVAARGAHLIDLLVRGEQGKPLVEVYVDAEDAVTTELCAELSRDIAGVIEQNNFVRGPYRLVVSSPGIDRPIQFQWQYKKHSGRLFELRVRETDVPSTVVGRLIGVTEDGVVIENENTHEMENFGFKDIIEARVKTPW